MYHFAADAETNRDKLYQTIDAAEAAIGLIKDAACELLAIEDLSSFADALIEIADDLEMERKSMAHQMYASDILQLQQLEDEHRRTTL